MTISTIAASSTVYSPVDSAHSKSNYGTFAALQILEKELDQLKQERIARRLSMFADPITLTSSPSPPPQIKRRQSSSPDPEKLDLSITDEILPAVRRYKSCAALQEQHIQKEPVVEKEKSTNENNENEKQKDSLLLNHQVESENENSSTISSLSSVPPVSAEKKQPKETNNRDREATEQPLVVKKMVNKMNNTGVKELTNSFMEKEEKEDIGNGKKLKPLHREKKPGPLRIQTMFDQPQLIPKQNPSNYSKNKETPLFLQARQNLKSTSSTPPPPAIAPSASKSASELYKLKKQQANATTAEKRTSTFMQPSKPLQISKSAQTTNMITAKNNNTQQEKRQEYKPKPLKDAFIGVKGLSQKFDPTKTIEQQQKSLALQKPKSKMVLKEKPILSPASQSVSRERRISAGSNSIRSAKSVTALSQLFSSSSSTTTSPLVNEPKSTPPRQSKPLPPIHHFQQQQYQQHKLQNKDKLNNTPTAMSLPSRSNSKKMVETNRLFHKTMPTIPTHNEKAPIPEFPNPLPVYTPMLSCPVAEYDEEKPQEHQQKIQEPAIETTGSAKKRVSFSSVVTSIPPPSPFPEDESEEETNKQRKPPLTMTSSHLLSLWQQQHEKERRATTIIPTTANPPSTGVRNSISNKNPPTMSLPNPTATATVASNKQNDTRGFWEAFTTEMNNRAAPDLRRASPPTDIRRDQPNIRQQQSPQQTNRFIPSTFATPNESGVKGSPLPPVSNTKSYPQPQEQEPMSPRKTWINMLQDRLVKKSQLEKLENCSPSKVLFPPSSQNTFTRSLWHDPTSGFGTNQKNKPTTASRKPVISFDEHPSKNITAPPLFHPTKNRPKKPSSFRKSQAHHHPMKNNMVGPEVSVPPVAVQRGWHRNY